MTYRVRNLVIAIGLALVAMLLTLFYVTNYKRSVQAGESNVDVWVAAKDVKPGTSGAELVKSKAIKSAEVTKRTVVAGAISSPEEIQGLVLSEPLYVGEQVTVRRFADKAAQGIRAQLTGTTRAVQFPGSPEQLLSGTLRAGDRIDLVAQLETGITRIVLRDLLVLREPQQPTEGARVAGDEWSVMLAVTDTEIQRLWHTVGGGESNEVKWSLDLRPVVDAEDSGERLENKNTVTLTGVSATEINRLRRGGR